MSTRKFVTKDSGSRKLYKSGFNRDIDDGKPRFDLIPTALLRRLAELYQRGAVKYGDENWKLANTDIEINRFKQSAWRHFISFQNGEDDEDHAMAVIWNIMAYEWHIQNKSGNGRGTIGKGKRVRKDK